MLSRLDPAINFRDGVDFSGACLAVLLLTDLRVTIDGHQRADFEAADLPDRRSSLGLMMSPRTPSTPAKDDRDLDAASASMQILRAPSPGKDLPKVNETHLITSRWTWPVPPIPIARAAPLLRSIAAPFTNGPRSLMRTITDRPLRALVTRTRVPKRSDRCAAVMAPGLNLSPEAVLCPANSLP